MHIKELLWWNMYQSVIHVPINVAAMGVSCIGAYSDSDSDKVYSTKIYTSTISGLHEFLRNTNNTIVLIYK